MFLNTSKVNDRNSKCRGKVKRGKLHQSFKKCRLISQGGQLPSAVQAVVVLTDEVPCDGLLTKVLSIPSPSSTYNTNICCSLYYNYCTFWSPVPNFQTVPENMCPSSPITVMSSSTVPSLLLFSNNFHFNPSNLSHLSLLSSSNSKCTSTSLVISLRISIKEKSPMVLKVVRRVDDRYTVTACPLLLHLHHQLSILDD